MRPTLTARAGRAGAFAEVSPCSSASSSLGDTDTRGGWRRSSKLAAQDAGAADNAQAALEWIAGEQGLRLVTQERIQTFCWYELPVKWLTSLDDKVRVTGALARALELLGLPRYAAICRSDTTRTILDAYEASIEKGKAAFRHAAAASGDSAARPPRVRVGGGDGV